MQGLAEMSSHVVVTNMYSVELTTDGVYRCPFFSGGMTRLSALNFTDITNQMPILNVMSAVLCLLEAKPSQHFLLLMHGVSGC